MSFQCEGKLFETFFKSYAWIFIQQIKACNAPYLCLAQTHCLTKNCTPWYISSTELLNKYKTLMPPLIISSHIVDKFIIAIVCNLLLVLNIWILTFHGFIKLICIIFVVYCWQRISIGYLLASISEFWLVNNVMVDSPTAFVRKCYAYWNLFRIFLTFCYWFMFWYLLLFLVEGY